MDMNGTIGNAMGVNGETDMPLGFGFALAMNEPAMASYAGLSEREKESLIMRCRDAKSKEEMQGIVDSLVTDRNVTGIMEEQREELS